MQRIKRNAAKCKVCGEVIESTFRHHFVTCSCGNLSVDGGHDYIRRGFRDGKSSYEDLNEYIEPYYECGLGWFKFLDEELSETEAYVKEKYGCAMVYGVSGEVAERLRKKSEETCELCGASGSLRNDRGWVQCRCDRCHNASREERLEIMRKAYENSRRA